MSKITLERNVTVQMVLSQVMKN